MQRLLARRRKERLIYGSSLIWQKWKEEIRGATAITLE